MLEPNTKIQNATCTRTFNGVDTAVCLWNSPHSRFSDHTRRVISAHLQINKMYHAIILLQPICHTSCHIGTFADKKNVHEESFCSSQYATSQKGDDKMWKKKSRTKLTERVEPDNRSKQSGREGFD